MRSEDLSTIEMSGLWDRRQAIVRRIKDLENVIKRGPEIHSVTTVRSGARRDGFRFTDYTATDKLADENFTEEESKNMRAIFRACFRRLLAKAKKELVEVEQEIKKHTNEILG